MSDRMDLFANLDTDVSFKKKIKFIVIMGMQGDLRKLMIVVVIDFKILRHHVLPGIESGLEIFPHFVTSVSESKRIL